MYSDTLTRKSNPVIVISFLIFFFGILIAIIDKFGFMDFIGYFYLGMASIIFLIKVLLIAKNIFLFKALFSKEHNKDFFIYSGLMLVICLTIATIFLLI